jgi:hypothetical protein
MCFSGTHVAPPIVPSEWIVNVTARWLNGARFLGFALT